MSPPIVAIRFYCTIKSYDVIMSHIMFYHKSFLFIAQDRSPLKIFKQTETMCAIIRNWLNEMDKTF